jgi:prepilin-type N-terminal cleavage/methylation domain-containing protein
MEQSLARRSRLSRSADLLSSARTGFSLVELSIVLVILGLLTGGILTGQNLIRAAELRSVVSDFQRYQAAARTFQSKYFALPGDMTNATAFWGDNSTYCADAAVADGSPGTCNGNGDGYIDRGTVVNQEGELFLFWQHLANAGLIEGSYTGIVGPSDTADHIFGVNAPPSKLSGAGWGSTYLNNTANTNAGIWPVDYRSWMTLGTDDGIWADGPIMTPSEVWNIDKKLDDGRPGTGKMHSYAVTSCTDQANNATREAAAYLLSGSNLSCSPIFNALR